MDVLKDPSDGAHIDNYTFTSLINPQPLPTRIKWQNHEIIGVQLKQFISGDNSTQSNMWIHPVFTFVAPSRSINYLFYSSIDPNGEFAKYADAIPYNFGANRHVLEIGNGVKSPILFTKAKSIPKNLAADKIIMSFEYEDGSLVDFNNSKYFVNVDVHYGKLNKQG